MEASAELDLSVGVGLLAEGVLLKDGLEGGGWIGERVVRYRGSGGRGWCTGADHRW